MPDVTDAKGVVSLFTGVGGLDAGLEKAGFTTRLALDNDPDAIATLDSTRNARLPIGGGRAHLEDATIVEADLRKLTKTKLRELWGRDERPALLAGGPPCQSFSSAGRMRSLHDERGRLFYDFVRTARALRPEFVLFENVQGLVTARDAEGAVGGVLALIQREFESAGYACSFALVNAADYGTPQRRVRLVMVGSRRHLLPGFPPAASHDRDGGEGNLLARWVSLREALADLPEPTGADVVRPREALAEQLAEVEPGSGIRVGGRVMNNRPGGHWGYRQDGFIADWEKPSRTIRSATTPDWLRLEDGSHRRLTWWECARLQGFPGDWRFEGTVTSKFRQIGNAVPVQLGEALGRSVLAALEVGPLARGKRPQSTEWPASFRRRIRYTKSEDKVNGKLRRRVKEPETAALVA